MAEYLASVVKLREESEEKLGQMEKEISELKRAKLDVEVRF
jgi:hypothetical protein